MEQKRSRTAQGVAAERAVLADMGVINDPYARGMLTPSMAVACGLARRSRLLRERSVTLAGLAARVLWFDLQVTKALDQGIEQIVIVGAGYDSRAWRLGRDQVRFFELDHRSTQRDKMRRAPGPGPVYVEVDLGADDAMEALAGRGLDQQRPVLFVLEGLAMYLTEGIARHQIAGLATSSARGSRLAVDFLPPPALDTTTDRRQRRLQVVARVASNENFRLLANSSVAVDLVVSCGWSVDEITTMREAARTLLPLSARLRIDAVSDRKTLVAAELDH